MGSEGADFRCTLCGRSSGEVRKLIAGLGVFICNDCVAACRQEVGPEPAAAKPESKPATGGPPETTLVDLPDSGHSPRRTMIGRAIQAASDEDDPECSFCTRPRSAVRAQVERPGARICNECIGLCEHIIAAEEGV